MFPLFYRQEIKPQMYVALWTTCKNETPSAQLSTTSSQEFQIAQSKAQTPK
jgi:hypothetical protein